MTQEKIKIHGHAIECRVYSEDPNKNFLPGSGKITFLREPNNRDSVDASQVDNNVRVETGVREKDEVSIFYDPMISKLVVFGENREIAIQRTIKALENYKIGGLPNNIEFIHKILNHPQYQKWDFDTNFIGKYKKDLIVEDAIVDKLILSNEDILESIIAKLLIQRKAANTDYSFKKFNQFGPWKTEHSYRVNYNKVSHFTIQDHGKDITVQLEVS